MPIHIRATAGEVAPVAFLVGDPARATRMAGMLSGSRCYNENRGLLGYTGTHEGIAVSVQTTAMGGPSAAIVLEELAMLGVKVVVRLGTCGAIGEQVNVLDLVIATGSVPLDGTTRQYTDGEPFAPVADFGVTRALVDAAGAGSRPVHIGLGMTNDVFYRQPEIWPKWRSRGVIAVEMEASALFTVALQRGIRAGAMYLAVDAVGDRASWSSDEAISAGTADLLAAGLAALPALARLV
jgi:purine-nucleoside phosphorylase